MAIAAASSLSLGSSHCHQCYAEEFYSSIPYKTNSGATKHVLDGCGASNLSALSFRCKTPFFGSASHVSSAGHDFRITKVSVAADYSDSVPDSSSYVSKGGYHPLEELKACRRTRETKLSAAEIARTAVEANSSAVLVFPGAIHCEPHDQTSWAEFKYVIDDYGDIFFEIFDDENILEDPGASNPVKALIGIDVPLYENTRLHGEYNISDIGNLDDIIFDDHYFEIMDSEASDFPVDWGMLETSDGVHPIYFAKCLSKAISMDYDRKMDYPSNGVSILGCLRPAFLDEESYIRRLFLSEDRDDFGLEWEGDDGPTTSSRSDGKNMNSTLYRLDIVGIELFSVYGVQSSVSLQDFQDAEPDILVHSTSTIVDRFNKGGINSHAALKALCKKKGLHVEEANLIGVDSLGMDVRVLKGAEVQTYRFPFKAQAATVTAAEKQIQQLLFPRSRRRKLKSHGDSFKDVYRY